MMDIHEMHSRFDLLLKIHARSLEEIRDIVVNKMRRLPQITGRIDDGLKNNKGGAIIILKKRYFRCYSRRNMSYFCCLSFFDDCHQSR